MGSHLAQHMGFCECPNPPHNDPGTTAEMTHCDMCGWYVRCSWCGWHGDSVDVIAAIEGLTKEEAEHRLIEETERQVAAGTDMKSRRER